MPVDLSQPALAACALLFVQNTFSTLVISYSRLRPGPAYVGSVVVALGELIKIVLNLLCNLIIFGCAATREELRRVYCTEERQPRAYCPTRTLSLSLSLSLSLTQPRPASYGSTLHPHPSPSPSYLALTRRASYGSTRCLRSCTPCRITSPSSARRT